MCKQTPIALAVAAVLGTLAFPAAAVRTIEINNTTNAVYVTSNTKAWDDYATSCVNATQTAGAVAPGDGCGTSLTPPYLEPPGSAKGSDEALFFWGGLGAATNSTVQLQWTPATSETSSAEVQAVRLLTPKDDDGNYLQIYGPDQQAIFKSTEFGMPDQLGWPDDDYRRGGIWSTWGRNDISDIGSETSPVNPDVIDSKGYQMQVAVTIGGSQIAGQLTPDLGAGSASNFWPGFTSPARSFDTTLPVNFEAQGHSLANGETVALSFYDASNGPSVDTDNPTAYLGDTLVQLKTPSTTGATDGTFEDYDPAEAGLMLLGTPDDAVVNYERSGTDLTATVSTRSGAGDVTGVTYRVFNQGGADSALGDGVANSYGAATASGDDTATLEIDNNTVETVNLALAENTSQRTLSFTTTPTLSASNATDVSSGRQTAATQSISSSTNGDGSDGGSHTQAIIFDTVGPILGFNDGSGIQEYGANIDLDAFEVGEEISFSVANIFGSNRAGLPSLAQLGDLTNLTINGVGLSDDTDFEISGIESGDVLTAQATPTALTFKALSAVSNFNVELSFDTDQGAELGGIGQTISFNLTGSAAVDGFTVTPDQGTAGLTFASNPSPTDPAEMAAVRAGTQTIVSANGTDPLAITVENTGGVGSTLEGNFAALPASTGTGQFSASDVPNFALAAGESTERTYGFTAAKLTHGDTTALSDTADQVINSEGRTETRTLVATTVGPVLDVNGQGDGGTIALGGFDIDDVQNIAVANIFDTEGEDYGNLTDLTIRNRSVSTITGDDLSLSGVAPTPTVIAAGAEQQLGIKAANDAQGGEFSATLTFDTDQNATFGGDGDDISYTVTGDVWVDEITVTPADNSQALEFVTVRAGAGSTMASKAGGNVAIDVSNTGDAGSTLNGQFEDLTLPSTGSADTASTGGTFAQLDAQGFSLGTTAPPATMGYEFTAGTFGLNDTTARTEERIQEITSDVSDRGAAPVERTIIATTVSPVLGVNDGAERLAYGSQIDLGTIDLATPGDETLKILTIANLFGDTSFADSLTSLTIANAAISGGGGLFSLDGTAYDSKQVADASESLPNMVIRFGLLPGTASVGTVLATLSFFTDMNRAFDTTTNEITFALFGTVINSAQAAPLPGTLALLGAGLFGMVALRRRRMLRLGH